jgi:hypothetical protein
MSLTKIYSLYRNMEEENVLLSFKGLVTSDLLMSLLSIMENKMHTMQESPKRQKKVFNVLVECLQNLYHHVDNDVSVENESKDIVEKHSAIILIVKERENFLIRTGNYIDNVKVQELRDRLETINSLDKDALRDYFQSSLNRSPVSPKGTAGLGLIDIARKSGNKLDFEFLSVNEEMSFFCLNVKID